MRLLLQAKTRSLWCVHARARVAERARTGAAGFVAHTMAAALCAAQFAQVHGGAWWTVRAAGGGDEEVAVGMLSPASLARMRHLFYATASRAGTSTPSPSSFQLWACHAVARYAAVARGRRAVRACNAQRCAAVLLALGQVSRRRAGAVPVCSGAGCRHRDGDSGRVWCVARPS